MGIFDNYECDNQLSLFDIAPKPCCGISPWLHITKCFHTNSETEQTFQMYYICPRCLKVPTDGTEWTARSYGSYKKAAADALNNWNNPKGTKFNDDLSIFCTEMEKFENQYKITTGKAYMRLKKGDFDEYNKQ